MPSWETLLEGCCTNSRVDSAYTGCMPAGGIVCTRRCTVEVHLYTPRMYEYRRPAAIYHERIRGAL